jgi:hypothetical protein
VASSQLQKLQRESEWQIMIKKNGMDCLTADDTESKVFGPSLGVGIVSWRSWKTLAHTLHTYRASGLFDIVDRAVIFFQDMSDKDIAMARHFGIDYTGGPNCGIAEGMRRESQYLNTDYVLFLENDCPAVVGGHEMRKQIVCAINHLEDNKIDIMRLRSRLNPGENFCSAEKYLRYYEPKDPEPHAQVKKLRSPFVTLWLRRILKQYNLHRMKGRSIYVEKAPESLFPDVIQKTEDGIWIADSSCIEWTNQSVLCKRDFFLEILMPYVDSHPSSGNSNGFQTPERPLNCAWWRTNHFKIGQGKGIFTHRRYDGSWRKTHPAFEQMCEVTATSLVNTPLHACRIKENPKAS